MKKNNLFEILIIIYILICFTYIVMPSSLSKKSITQVPSYSSDKSYIVYKNNCSSCHVEGNAETGIPNLFDKKSKYGDVPEVMKNIINNGKPGNGMPAFKKVLSNKEVEDLIQFFLNNQK